MDFWNSDGRHILVTGVTPPNMKKRSSHTTDERNALLQRVTTVTHLWRPSRAWRWTLYMDWDVGIKGRLVLPFSAESPIFLPPLLVLLYFLHWRLHQEFLTADFPMLYICVPVHSSRVEEFSSEQILFSFAVIFHFPCFGILFSRSCNFHSKS